HTNTQVHTRSTHIHMHTHTHTHTHTHIHTHTLTNHITHKTQSFMGCREKKMQRKKGENISSPSPTLCHSFLLCGPVCATLSSASVCHSFLLRVPVCSTLSSSSA